VGGGGWGVWAVSKLFFQPFGPYFGLKIREGGRAPGPLPWTRQCSPSQVNLSECKMRNKLTPLPEPRVGNSARDCCDCLALTQLTQLGKPNFLCHYDEKCSARRVTLPSIKGSDPARGVTLLDEPSFSFSCKWVAKFCKEM